jgi:hypothetical protein
MSEPACLTRAADEDRRDLETRGEFAPLHALTTQQRRILLAVQAYQREWDEPCPGALLARKFRIHNSTIQKHLAALHRRGWLRSPSAPASLKRWLE